MKYLIIFVIIFFVRMVSAQSNPWVSYQANTNVYDIAEENGTLWIGTNGGVVHYDLSSGNKEYFKKTNSGLAFDYVNSVYIDNQGSKWFCTFDGVSKFDGSSWITFNKDSMGITRNWVHDAVQDDAGNMWFATQMGVTKFDGNTWTIYSPATDTAIASYDMMGIDKDSNGNIWVVSRDDGYGRGGLFRYDGSQWKSYTMQNSAIPDYYFYDIKTDQNDNLWLASNDHGLIKFDGSMFTMYNNSTSYIGDIRVKHLFVDASDNIWASLEKYISVGGISKFDGTSFTNYNATSGNFPGDNGSCAFITASGRFFAGIEFNGMYEMSGSNWVKRPLSNCGITSNSLNTVFVDSHDNKWFGTQDSGLVKFGWRGWKHYSVQNSDLPDNAVLSINEDSNGNIWVGTKAGAAKISGDEITVYDKNNTPEIYGEWINDVAVHDGKVYLATNNGYSVFDGSSWSIFYKGNLPNYPASDGAINAITFDADGNLWMALLFYGVIKYDGTTCTGYTADNSGLTFYQAKDLAFDSLGNLWVATFGTDYYGNNGALYKFDGNSWYDYRTNNSGLVCDYLNCVTFDADGALWTGGVQYGSSFTGGFSILKEGAWESFMRENSELPYSYVNKIDFDSEGNAWIALADYGAVAYNPSGVTPIKENRLQTLQSFALGQNYPNPFNPTTVISYQVGAIRSVELTVYNALGQKVQTLVEGHQESGLHTVTFNAAQLSSGIYFYRLTANGSVQTKKMILMR